MRFFLVSIEGNHSKIFACRNPETSLDRYRRIYPGSRGLPVEATEIDGEEFRRRLEEIRRGSSTLRRMTN